MRLARGPRGLRRRRLEDRPGLLAALDAVKTTGAGILVVAKRDRLARDVFTAALVQRLCERQGATSGPPTASRTATARRRPADAEHRGGHCGVRAGPDPRPDEGRPGVKKARGERVGGVPYGWRVGEDSRLVEVPAEQEAVALARRLRGEGRSLRQIGVALVADGYRPRGGGAWAVQTLARVSADKR